MREQYDNDTDATYYDPVIIYSYEVKGKKYRNDRRTFESVGRGKEWSEKIVKKYKKGYPVTVYYKPREPEHSTLERGIFRSTYYGIYIGYAFIGLVIAGSIGRTVWLIRESYIYGLYL